ncbi:MAG: hypothetical protein Q7W30_06405 [Coriobacteriia bacterium]|nr:hypothetical protein [Coriobacteriia bacterium]
MHGKIEILGPGAFVVIGLLFAVVGLAFYVVVNAVRRKEHDFAGVAEGRWFYVAAQGVYVLAFALSQIPALAKLAPWLGDIRTWGTPISLVLTFAYLLRVVFPTQKRIDLRLQAQENALQAEYGLESDGVGIDGDRDVPLPESAEGEERASE